MKKLFALFTILFFVGGFVLAQDGYQFTDIKRLPCTSVKDQASSGTCWSFSTLSFIESEMMRIGKKDVPDLSTMFTVHKCYEEKAMKYVRMQGKTNFGSGGSFHDNLFVMNNFGMMPNDAYQGLCYGEKKHAHGELDNVLKAYVDVIVKNENKSITISWTKGFTGILDAYLGAVPEKFTYKGKSYTPRTFADEVVGLNPDDYVEISSFSHHPMYSKFIIEIPDNWLWESVYNVPLNELTQIMDNAINNGYTIGWGGDVSERGFNYSKGYAVVPDADVAKMTKTEREKWDKKTEREKTRELNSSNPGKEKEITQENRQLAFDNQTTTDDHGMHIIGLAKDQLGTKYYIVKNSWDVSEPYEGYFYASEAYVKYKTTSIIVHKNAVPAEIKKKLGIN